MSYGPKRVRYDLNATEAASVAFQPVCGNAGHATVIKQQFRKKSYKGSGKKKTKVERLLLHHAASQNALTSRWQALSLYNAPTGALPLTNKYTSAATTVDLPMYCWNLTAMPFNAVNETNGIAVNNVKIVTFPAYRLQKNTTTDRYQWNTITQINGGFQGSGTSTGWELEWDSINAAPIVEVNKYCVDWAKPKFVFKGANKRPVKIHIALARFEHCGAGPNRAYYDGSTVQTFDISSTDELTDGALFWDQFWSTRISNPIRTTIKPPQYNLRKPVHIYAHESFVLGEDVSINNDPVPLQATMDKFIRMDRFMKTVNPYRQSAFGAYMAGDNTTGAAFGYPSVAKVPGGVPTFSATQAAVPQYNRDVFLIVWADVYDQAKDGNYPVSGTDADFAPSFDINLRCKFSYND